MEYQNVSSRSSRRNQHHGHSTRPTKLAMRFFGSKQRGGKRDGGQQQQLPHGSAAACGGEVEARTDASRKDHAAGAKDSGTRELVGGCGGPAQTQPPHIAQSATPKRKGVQGLLKSPALRGESPRSGGGGWRRATAAVDHDLSAHSKESNGSRAGTPKPRPSPGVVTSPRQLQQQGSGGIGGAGEATKAKTPPPSILHKNNTHFNFDSHPSPPPPTYGMSPYPPGSANPSRVRFMSAESSVASTEASGIHLMAGGANSVASSSAMSSSEGNRENVFDRVLNMVMAEEHERLNAMGFARQPDPKSDAATRLKRHQRETAAADQHRLRKVDAKAKAVVEAVGNSASGSDDDLGLLPPRRNDLAPIDIDTGLEVGDPNDAPIDMDTGLEIGGSPIDADTGLEITYGGGGDDEYHDLNDDGVDDDQWRRLNDKALAEGMGGLRLEDSRRVRSYESSRERQPPPSESHHSRNGSDPERFAHGKGARANKKTPGYYRKSPSFRKGGGGGAAGGKKGKKFWDKNGGGGKDFESDEWVAFDGKQGGQQQFDDLAAF